MVPRRLTRLLLVVLTLHLNLLGADTACVRHPAASTGHSLTRTAAISMSSMTHATHTDGVVHSTAGTHAPCETPAPSECCRSFVSCAVVFAGGADAAGAAWPQARDAISQGVLHVPLSEIVAPDPPPPKA